MNDDGTVILSYKLTTIEAIVSILTWVDVQINHRSVTVHSITIKRVNNAITQVDILFIFRSA